MEENKMQSLNMELCDEIDALKEDIDQRRQDNVALRNIIQDYYERNLDLSAQRMKLDNLIKNSEAQVSITENDIQILEQIQQDLVLECTSLGIEKMTKQKHAKTLCD
jgi:hypothetical protein